MGMVEKQNISLQEVVDIVNLPGRTVNVAV